MLQRALMGIYEVEIFRTLFDVYLFCSLVFYCSTRVGLRIMTMKEILNAFFFINVEFVILFETLEMASMSSKFPFPRFSHHTKCGQNETMSGPESIEFP